MPGTAPAYGALVPPDRRGVRAAVARTLHVGVLASAAVMIAGYVVSGIREPSSFGSAAVERGHLAGRAHFVHSLGALLSALGHGAGEAVIVAGILLLILTPVAGLVAALVAFARRGDLLFTALSATVLVVILGSFAVGWALS